MEDVITTHDYRFWLLLGGTAAVFALVRLAPRWIDVRGKHITPGELKQRLDQHESFLLLDVRSAGEYFGPDGRIGSSRLLPLEQLDQQAARRVIPPGDIESTTVVTICNTGIRAAVATRRLRRAGLRALTLRGGLEAWQGEYLPLVRGVARDA
jgi:rhodanese-related sulfurtransferase